MKRIFITLSLFVIVLCCVFNQSYAQYKRTTNLNPYATPSYYESSQQEDHDNRAALINESFDGTTFPPTGWVTTPGTDATWSRLTAGTHPVVAPHSGAGLAMFNSWTADVGDVALLISPSFSCAGNIGLHTASFWMYHEAQYGLYDTITLFVNSAPNLTGSPVRLGVASRIVGTGWVNHSFNIPASITGATEYLILRGTSDYGNDCHIDDVAVNSPFSDDMGAISVDISLVMTPGGVIPKATVKNFGTTAQSNVQVSLNIYPPTATYWEYVIVPNLAAGATTQVTFPLWNAALGTWTLWAGTHLAGDQNPNNDSVSTVVSVVPSMNPAFCFLNNNQPAKFYLEAPGGGFTTFGPATTWLSRGGAYIATGPGAYKWFVLASDFNLYSVDTATGVPTLVGATGVPTAGTVFLSGLTYDKTTSTLYAGYLSGSYPAFAFSLYTINQTTGAATLVATSSTTGTFFELACSPAGQLYVIEHLSSAYGKLWAVNKTTAALTLVGTNLGAIVSSNFQDIDFSPAGVLYFTASMGSDGVMDGLYTINTTTGLATLVGTFPGVNTQVVGLGIKAVDPGVSISENSSSEGFSLFPNPASEKISVISKDNEIIKTVKVFSLSGQVVCEEDVNFIATTLNTGNYKSGFYFVQVTTDKGIYTTKIAVVK